MTPASPDQPVPAQAQQEAAQKEPARRSFSKRRLARQFLRFGIVGASGFLVNQGVFILSKKTLEWGWDHTALDVFMNIAGTQFNVRWFHVFQVLAFIVANIWNFALNRYWTFSGAPKRAWWKQLPQFMAVGVFGLLISLAVATALLNPDSPIALSTEVFDGSTGLRTPEYWGNFIGVMFAIPANFIFNKLWTFRSLPAEKTKSVREIPARAAGVDPDPAALGDAETTKEHKPEA